MSKKYRELPAFETNEFEVGDVINIYGIMADPSLIYQRKVLHTDKDLVYFTTAIMGVHFKQCRKLEEIKPREVYLHKDGLHLEFVRQTLLESKGKEYLKFREVLEDE